MTYIHDPEKLPAVLIDQLSELGIDYIDVFHWGWITESTEMLPLVKTGLQLKRQDSPYIYYREILQRAEEVNATLLQKGLVRSIGASFHSRAQARAWMRNLDVIMLRYNLAHPGAEQEVAPFLYGQKERDPGVVVFNVAHEGNLYFNSPPASVSPGVFVPSIPDCYRFALTQPWVDMVLTGPTCRQEIDQALLAMEQGPMDHEACQATRKYATLWREAVLSSAKV